MIANFKHRWRSLPVLNLPIILLLSTICWIAHFWYLGDFGLYEDDYGFVGEPISTNLNGLIQLVTENFTNFKQGRPLGFSLAFIFSYFSFGIAGLSGVYVCGYLVVITNTLLFYSLMLRLSNSHRLALFGGLAFALFPADTTAPFLTHSLGLYCCITFFLLALHAYLSSRIWLAYLLITASLISYESCLLLFTVAPLLTHKWERKVVKPLIQHILILSLILILTILLRKLVGESRITELNLLAAIGTSLKHTLIGPFVSLGMYIYRPIYTLVNLSWELLILLPISGLLIWLMFRHVSVYNDEQIFQKPNAKLIPRSQLWSVGVILLFLAYPITIILNAGDISGRESRVHLAAIIGGSMIFALCCEQLVLNTKYIKHKRLVPVGLATLFTLLIGFGLIVQQDYRLAWSKQQNFWLQVTKLCPDMQEGTVILVERDELKNPDQMRAYGWSMPIVLERIYKFPPQWQVIPRTYPIYPDWQQKIDNPDQLPLAKITEWLTFIAQQHSSEVSTQSTIMLKVVNGRLTRLDRLSLNSGITLNFKPPKLQSKIDFPHRQLYPYLINDRAITSSL